MTTDLHHHVAPLFVDQMEAVVIDPDQLALQIQAPTAEPLHLPHRGRCPSDQHDKEATKARIGRQIFRRDLALALASRAVHYRNALLFSPSPQPPGKAACQPHQMGVVEVLIVNFEIATPSTKPSSRLAQRKVGIEYQQVND